MFIYSIVISILCFHCEVLTLLSLFFNFELSSGVNLPDFPLVANSNTNVLLLMTFARGKSQWKQFSDAILAQDVYITDCFIEMLIIVVPFYNELYIYIYYYSDV